MSSDSPKKTLEPESTAATSVDSSDLVTMTREEFDAAVAAASVSQPNPRPAWEEGPHLQDPTNRAAKRRQMIEAGVTADDDWISDDMRAILQEQE